MSQTFSERGSETGFPNEVEIFLPPECIVVMYNDDFTTMEFVVRTLIKIFDKTEVEATAMMKKIHSEGSGVVGVYTYDIAVTKAGLAVSSAKKNGYPLRVEVKRQ